MCGTVVRTDSGLVRFEWFPDREVCVESESVAPIPEHLCAAPIHVNMSGFVNLLGCDCVALLQLARLVFSGQRARAIETWSVLGSSGSCCDKDSSRKIAAAVAVAPTLLVTLCPFQVAWHIGNCNLAFDVSMVLRGAVESSSFLAYLHLQIWSNGHLDAPVCASKYLAMEPMTLPTDSDSNLCARAPVAFDETDYVLAGLVSASVFSCPSPSMAAAALDCDVVATAIHSFQQCAWPSKDRGTSIHVFSDTNDWCAVQVRAATSSFWRRLLENLLLVSSGPRFRLSDSRRVLIMMSNTEVTQQAASQLVCDCLSTLFGSFTGAFMFSPWRGKFSVSLEEEKRVLLARWSTARAGWLHAVWRGCAMKETHAHTRPPP